MKKKVLITGVTVKQQMKKYKSLINANLDTTIDILTRANARNAKESADKKFGTGKYYEKIKDAKDVNKLKIERTREI